ncbi:nucleotidyltransferase family protein [Vacuolonema iberomarrocanum]|uniref:nucleotidyltransferase family protein n=1 Tax=Vacuolonema iberomarrocanum TaxID=3454632 RepID=UPI001A058AF2|nr:nucleotidyltransferase family protein [filamentous cyanobacterium LEGE 07170]
MSQSSILAVILAAGASRRMGRSKQLLPYRGQTLLGHVIQCALASSCRPVIVILGAHAEAIAPAIEHLSIDVIHNANWHQGISSSIRCGVSYIRDNLPSTDGILFLTCDQPFVSRNLIEQLIECYNDSNKPIIASQYEGTIGIPVLFSRPFYSNLTQLEGDYGAKKLIQKHPNQVASIGFPEGHIDLDTFVDYQRLISE